jgi:hypothetical protein
VWQYGGGLREAVDELPLEVQALLDVRGDFLAELQSSSNEQGSA